MPAREAEIARLLLGSPVRAATTYQPISADDVHPMMRNYKPTFRERIGNTVYDAAGLFGLGGTANRMRNDAMAAVDFVPVLGDAVGFDDARQAFNAGNYGSAAVNAGASLVGTIPGGGDMAAGVAKAIFGGIGAKTANRELLAKAEGMFEEGFDRKSIWEDTGWFKGPDGKWRFEIDDSRAAVSGERALKDRAALAGRSTYQPDDYAQDFPLDRVMSHTMLYRDYPELRERPVRLMSPDLGYQYKAGYEEAKDKFHLSGPVSVNDDEFSLGHEVQHAIQEREGFARGGNAGTITPDGYDSAVAEAKRLYEAGAWDGFDAWRNSPDVRRKNMSHRQFVEEYQRLAPEDEGFKRALEIDRLKTDLSQQAINSYRRLAGEVEARNVQSRMNMTAEQRRLTAPWETEDVPFSQQIVRPR